MSSVFCLHSLHISPFSLCSDTTQLNAMETNYVSKKVFGGLPRCHIQSSSTFIPIYMSVRLDYHDPQEIKSM